ncbi:hypothetical protein [Streptomyces sp. M18.1]
MVLDEFHTYDGAQGTDVAMLLRRLAMTTGQRRPLGSICLVATSATLGERGARAAPAPFWRLRRRSSGCRSPRTHWWARS